MFDAPEMGQDRDVLALCVRLNKLPDEVRSMTATDFDTMLHYIQWLGKQ